MKDFREYNHIDNVERDKTIDEIKYRKFDTACDWSVTEKGHGSNISAVASGSKFDQGSLYLAKRSGKIGNNSEFYGADKAWEKNSVKIKQLFSYLYKSGQVKSEVQLYGELIGGKYEKCSHKEIEGPQVQKEVQYTPKKEFYFFDLMIDGKYVPVAMFNDLMEKFGLFYAKPLFTGSFEDCLAYSNEFQTTIPSHYGLPEIEGNICEGIVIKPVSPLFFCNGSRAILKNKNEKFKGKKSTKVKKFFKLSDEVAKIINDVSQYINKNRLRSVLSKLGPVTNKDFSKIMGLFVVDALDAYEKDNYGVLNADDYKAAKRDINKVASTLIRANFLNILDGAF